MANETWLDHQNSKEALLYRAACDRYWEVAQYWRGLEFTVFVCIPTALAIFAQFMHSVETFAAMIGFGFTLLDAVIAYPLIAMTRLRAAQVQDQYDQVALSFKPSRIRQLGAPDMTHIHETASQQSRKRSKFNENWYTPTLGLLPRTFGRIACMLESVTWDGGLRNRYTWLVGFTIVFMFLGFLTYGIISKLTIETLVVRIFFPLTPVLLWAGREIWDASESAKSVSHLREALAEMWDAMIDSQIDESSAEEKSIEIQSAIYSYRINTFPIPNLIYKLLRVKTAENLRHVAESRLSKYQIKFAKII